ncbi:hypothetical protein O6H91_07G017100 [Diphasiastrum complanatum]|nr:hypothetical protein O6H91_07G017100 [Diphasiastrum complanatum]
MTAPSEAMTLRQQLMKLCKEGLLPQAIEAAHLMNQRNIPLPSTIFYSLIQQCTNKKDLTLGRQVQTLIANSALRLNCFLCNHLIRMYNSGGSLAEALEEFHRLPQKDHHMWTSIISAHGKNGHSQQAINLYFKMRECDVKPSVYTYVAVLKACAEAGALAAGKAVHQHVIDSRCVGDVYVGNSLIHMYAKCGRIDDAQRVFFDLSQRDVVSWNALVAGCVQNGRELEACEFFEDMRRQGLQPDRFTFASVFKAIGRIGSLDKGRQVHNLFAKTAIGFDNFLGSSLIDMYAKCGSIDDACQVFLDLPQRDVVSWNALIAGLGLTHAAEALHLFERMVAADLKPDKFTFASVFKACSSIGASELANHIHGLFSKSGLGLDSFLGSSIVDMYAKCGDFKRAWEVFATLPERNLVVWTTMISGCVQHHHYHEALQLFEKMQAEGFEPDQVTFVSVIKACSSISALGQGKSVHIQFQNSGLEMDLLLGNALVDMYAKCGSMCDAQDVFSELARRDVVSWSTMIVGYAQHGHGEDALQFFKNMQEEGVKPDKVTFVGVLYACSHLGLLDEGYQLFRRMHDDFGIKPEMDHYTLMVDLFGRAGKLDLAHAFINKMTSIPTVDVWLSLLGACKTHGNLEFGLISFDSIMKLEPTNATAYVLMSNIFASAGGQKQG